MFPLHSNHLRPPLGDDNRLYWDYDALTAYEAMVLAFSPIAYWPLKEASGTVAKDISGNAFHGTYSGLTLGQTGIGDGNTCPYFDQGVLSIDCYSAGLAAAFNGAEGAMGIWAKPWSADMWASADNYYCMKFDADGNNIKTILMKNDDMFNYLTRSGGTWKTHARDPAAYGTGWQHYMMTWSEANDRMIAYKNGAADGAAATGLGTWAGSPASGSSLLGAWGLNGADAWKGWMAHPVIFDSELSASDVLAIATV